MRAERFRELTRRRLAAGVSLAAIASRFGRGVSRERIRQIEAAERVRPETRRRYERALAKAIRQRDAIGKLLRLLSE